MSEQIRTFSYGGGVQSTAALVLAARGEIDFPTFLFANVGDDSEDPATLEYVEKFAKPYAEAEGLQLIEVQRTKRSGEKATIWEKTMGPTMSVGIPVRMSNGAPASRACTVDFKVMTIRKWLRSNGASRTSPAAIGLGISLDEIHRMRNSDTDIAVHEFPLIDLRISRSDCKEIISRSGLPVPPRSACFFCPFHSIRSWVKLKRERPHLFGKSVEMERYINEKRSSRGLDPVFMTRALIPLDEAVEQHERQGELFNDYDGIDACESGHCWT